ncbi:MAG: High-affinity nickel-transporter [Dehalococcoidia bacterium]
MATALVATLLAIALLAARPPTVDAHPLGNFTVNRFSRIELYSDVIRVSYVLDMAEIPAFQERGALDADGDGSVSEAESASYSERKGEELARGLDVVVDGAKAELRVLSREMSLPDGQGGLSTLRLSLLLEAPAPAAEARVSYRDSNYADRLGWKEIVVRAGEGVALRDSTAPAEGVTDGLRAYPDDLLSSPLDVTEASFRYTAGHGELAPPAPATPQTTPSALATDRPSGGFVSLVAMENLSLPVLVLAVLGALGFGALHALEPGHGKTFVAAYFIGVKGTGRQALLLGMIIATTHAVGVLAIALVTLYGSRFILPEHLYPWLSLLSALIVVGLGARLLLPALGRLRRWRRDGRHGHGNGGGHHHAHPAAPQDGRLPWRSLFWLGLADGMTPSPSALVVLLAAVSLDRVGMGVLLVLAFSVGLAGVLAGVSLLLVYARRLLDRFNLRGVRPRWLAGADGGAGLVGLLPAGGGLALVVVGLVLTLRALSQPGLPGL